MNVGDKAPELLGINEKGEEVRLNNYKGRKIVLYFYPKDKHLPAVRPKPVAFGIITQSYVKPDMK